MRVTMQVRSHDEAVSQCDICDKPTRRFLKAHAPEAQLLTYICLRCARRIGKAAEVRR